MGVFPFPMPFSGPPKFGSFSPLALFAASEPGGWYDPSDLTTLFQDAAGTTPVTAVEQPVGLVLDKSKGLTLGGEQSPALSAYLTELTGTWAVSGGNYAFTDTVGGQVRPGVQWPTSSLPAGSYKVVVVVASITGATQIRMDGVGADDQLLTVGTNTRIVRVTSTSRPRLRLEDTSTSIGDGFAITSVSIRELPGSHLSQSTSTARPVLSARVNLLTYTEDLSNSSGWTVTGATRTASSITEAATTGLHYVLTTSASISSVRYRITAKVRNVSGTRFFKLGGAGLGGINECVLFQLSGSGTVYLPSTSNNMKSATIAPTSVSGQYLVTIEAIAASSLGFWFGLSDANTSFGNESYLGNTGNTLEILEPDIRVANAGVGLPAYQRVGAATYGVTNPTPASGNPDYDTMGFPLYLKFDGTDDFLVSGTINPGVDKAQVFAGVRKVAGGDGCIYELSANWNANTGSFLSFSTNPGFDAASRGTAAPGTTLGASVVAAVPATAVLTASHDIAGDLTAHRFNGATAVNATGDKGTGNFGNYPLYVGSRGGSTFPFNGQLYSLILRFSAANLDAATIASTETWVNNRTKAY